MKNNFKLKLLLSLISEVNDLAKSLQDSYKDEYRKELIKKIQAKRNNNKQLDYLNNNTCAQDTRCSGMDELRWIPDCGTRHLSWIMASECCSSGLVFQTSRSRLDSMPQRASPAISADVQSATCDNLKHRDEPQHTRFYIRARFSSGD